MCPSSFAAGARGRALGWALVGSGAGLLAVAYTLPTVRYDAVLREPETYSIYGGIEVLWSDGNWFLAAIVFAFSIIFPVGKLVALAGLLLAPRRGVSAGPRGRLTEALPLLGKWSMLDVFVIAGFVGAMQLGVAQGASRAGIHVFALAIVVSMFAAEWVARLERGGVQRPVVTGRLPGGALRRAAPLMTLAALGCTFALPFFEVRVSFLFANEVGSWRTTRALYADRELGLAGALLVWVWLLPLVRALASARLRWSGGGARLRRLALRLDEWGMLAVFALALGIVWVKLDELATTTIRLGVWSALAAAAAGEWDAWLLRRDLRPTRETGGEATGLPPDRSALSGARAGGRAR